MYPILEKKNLFVIHFNGRYKILCNKDIRNRLNETIVSKLISRVVYLCFAKKYSRALDIKKIY